MITTLRWVRRRGQMWWKVAGAGALVAAALIAIVSLPIMDVKVTVDLPPVAAAPRSCGPVTLSIEALDGRAKLKLDGAPTEPSTYLADLSKKRAGCSPASIPIYIVAESTVKYGDFTTLTKGLKGAGYTKLYLTQVARP